ncbi:MAG: hypothetical protein FJZ56_03415 [Chlamydiae bacterium]|nr:hypothetical protein [Chlamydiota bacterium]
MIDAYFAKQCLLLAKTDDPDFFAFCAYMMKSCLEGNIACKITKDESLPKAENHEAVFKGSQKQYSAVLSDIENNTLDTPIGRKGSIFYIRRRFEEQVAIFEFLKNKNHQTVEGWQANVDLLSSVNQEQKEAIDTAGKKSFLIISGGPGRGKTYVAKEILKQFFHNSPKGSVIVTAPTGKAVSRYQGLENVQTTTLHRLLGIKESAYGSDALILADLLIIDECSMIDIHLWALLFKALSPNTRVILIGDPHQLPPIETGTFFQDLCSMQEIPHVKLKQCLRSDNQEILQAAEAVFYEDEKALIPFISPYPSIKELIEKAFNHFILPTNEKPSPDLFSSFSILCSLRKGPYGCDAINTKIEEKFYQTNKLWIPIPILITKNSYHLELFNGDVGMLWKNRENSEEDIAFFGDKALSPKTLPPYEKAFAISCHKSQGSEYDHLYFVLAEGSECFGKEMLYTAITRAKKSISIFSKKETLLACLHQKTERHSFILESFSK